MAWRDPWENVDRANALRMQSDAQGVNMLSALQGAQTNALQRQQMEADMGEKVRLRDRQRQIEQAMIGAGGDLEKAIPAIMQFAPQDAIKMKQDFEKAQLDAEGKRATTAKARADALKSVHDISKQSFGGVMQTPTPEAAMAAINQVQATLKSLGLPGDLTSEIQKVQAFRTPDEIRQWAAGNAMAADKLLPQFQTRNNGGTTDTLAINPVTNKVDVVNSIRNTMSPGEAARLGQAERHFQAGQNAPQYMETSAGLVALPKKLGAGQTPVGVPVLGPDNQPLTKPLKDIPSNVVSGMQENNRALAKIDTALAAIKGDPEKTLPKDFQADPQATGWKGLLPNPVLTRVDPKGVDTRALIADIGSLKIHDRSGAAVSASEFPRLAPFVPSAADDPATVVKKLNNFRREYALIQQEMGDYYSAANGFKEYKPRNSAAPANAGGNALTPQEQAELQALKARLRQGGG